MNKNSQHIVIIGGVAAGTKTAAKVRREHPHCEITIFTEEPYISYAGCGQPYYISGHIQQRANLLARTPEQFFSLYQVQVQLNHRVMKIDAPNKQVEVENLETGLRFHHPYDQLVIATGASSIVPRLPGIDFPGVYSLRSIDDMDAIRAYIDRDSVNEAIVVGGGFIGLEMVESLVARNIKVTLVERLPLPAPIFDPLIGHHINNTLQAHGVRVRLGSSLEAVIGSPQYGVRAVTINGQEQHADLVLLCIGVRPNVGLAKEAGIALGPTGAIAVDDHLRTNVPDIYAAGDCSEMKHLVTGKPVWIPLGSTANRQGRVLGINLAGGSEIFPGVLGTSIFRIFDLNVARTGAGEKEAVEAGFDVETVVVPAGDAPHYMPEGKTVITKLIIDKKTERVLGAECWGPGKVDKVIDTLATAITLRANVADLQQLDLAYAPPFAPPLGNATTSANVVRNKLDHKTDGIAPLELKSRLDAGESVFLLDVRPPQARAKLVTTNDVNIPVAALRERLNEIPKDRLVVTTCNVGLNAALACLILKQLGLANVRYLDGGVTAWPAPVPGPFQ
ncbi:MAG: FAD-dependent oxidoreductase [bacterium]|jgi:NADPH-dependent 2,4-dienoyl-CoA reductase/sulfur reductase-like enzyme/rhodanese-related sulfurtransferase|nr:FAD-dependent oxidoreductase [bacterium]